MTRPIYIVLGWLFVGLGVLGIIFPLVPTTPFLLVAVWAFTRSSPALAEKIRNNRYAGPYIRDWQDNGVIPVQGKVASVGMMSAMVAYLGLGTETPNWVVATVAASLVAVAIYIVSRPSIPPG